MNTTQTGKSISQTGAIGTQTGMSELLKIDMILASNFGSFQNYRSFKSADIRCAWVCDNIRINSSDDFESSDECREATRRSLFY